MADRYITAAKGGTAEITEKRSKFIAHVKPVSSEEDAVAFLNEIKQEHWNATHNVYAYIIRKNNIMRYSDDGEPGGTAGLPVLDILKREGLTDIIVVVTRYFGGVLLGTGGLVHAYSKSAKAGIEAVGITEMVLCRMITADVEYPLWGKLQNELSKWNQVFADEAEYSDKVHIPLFIPDEDAEAFCRDITDKMNGQITLDIKDTKYKAIHRI